MVEGEMRFVRPAWLRLTYAAASLLLSVVVLAALSQAGKPYVWCQALQQVMPHSCCAGAASEQAPGVASIATVEDDCCEARRVPLLDNWTPADRGAELSAPFVAVLSYQVGDADREAHSASPASHDPTMRTGPPQSRVLAQLMVFRI
jgi:hypothetical protein